MSKKLSRIDEIYLREAREVVSTDEKLRAAVCWGEMPVFERDDTTKCVLFWRVKDADAFLREKKAQIEDSGDKCVRGTLARGIFLFESGLVLVLNKERR